MISHGFTHSTSRKEKEMGNHKLLLVMMTGVTVATAYFSGNISRAFIPTKEVFLIAVILGSINVLVTYVGCKLLDEEHFKEEFKKEALIWGPLREEIAFAAPIFVWNTDWFIPVTLLTYIVWGFGHNYVVFHAVRRVSYIFIGIAFGIPGAILLHVFDNYLAISVVSNKNNSGIT